MKTIYQNTEVAFNSISIQDAITMVSVVDHLCAERAELINKIEHHDFINTQDEINSHNRIILIEDQIRILLKLGFCPSSSVMLQNFELENNSDSTSRV